MTECNGVFEGGGVRGIGHVGAACAVEKAGYRFVDLAGSSAGAIVAALLAAGYSCGQLMTEMRNLEYFKFKGKSWEDYLGAAGKILSILLTFGIYHTDYLEQWLERRLEEKNAVSFGDLKKKGRTLKITASDLTTRRLLIFPDDLKEFHIDPDGFPIARAVRMSASIPVYFEPMRLTDATGRVHFIVEGGLLSTYPIWLLDQEKTRPTFGFRFQEKGEGEKLCCGRMNLAEYLKSIVSTCLDAIDNSRYDPKYESQTICIPTSVRIDGKVRTISATDFQITSQEELALFENGKKAAEQFLELHSQYECDTISGE